VETETHLLSLILAHLRLCPARHDGLDEISGLADRQRGDMRKLAQLELALGRLLDLEVGAFADLYVAGGNARGGSRLVFALRDGGLGSADGDFVARHRCVGSGCRSWERGGKKEEEVKGGGMSWFTMGQGW
jgi:hypothetical protein